MVTDMKKYSTPELTVFCFTGEDVLTASDLTDDLPPLWEE